MRAVTIPEAKVRLAALVKAAVGGEQVVIMRGSRHIAAIVPVFADDIELSPRLTDDQAMRFWQGLARDRKRGATAAYSSVTDAVTLLAKRSRGSRVTSTHRRARPRPRR